MRLKVRSLLQLLFRRSAFEREMKEEMHFHLEQHANRIAASGVPQQEALRRARLEFGGIEAYKERCREARGAGWIDELARNLRLAFRSMRMSPGFTSIALLSLAIGIGANTALFSLLDRLVLTTLPVHDPGKLHQFVQNMLSLEPDRYQASYLKFERLHESFPIFDELFGWAARQTEGTVGGQTQPLQLTYVTGRYFPALGVRPALGNLISENDDRYGGASDVVVLSHRFWQNVLAADPAVLSRTIQIRRNIYRVIGVAPPEFLGAEPNQPVDLYAPMHAVEHDAPVFLTNDWVWMHIMCRLKPGISVASANIVLREGSGRFIFARPLTPGEMRRPIIFRLEDGSHGYSDVRREFSRPVVALMGLVGVVFLIACANLATMLMVRGVSRTRETVVRVALGASQSQLLRQSMTECLLLALVGGAVGLLAAHWITTLLLNFIPDSNRIEFAFHADIKVLLFTFALTLAAGLIFGFLPSLRASRLRPEAALRAHSSSIMGRRGRVAEMILAAQLAALLLLLAGAGLFGRTLWNLNSVSGGFARDSVVFALPSWSAVPSDQQAAATGEIVERISASPHFASVSMGRPPAVPGGAGRGWAAVSGYELAPDENNHVDILAAGAGYFRTLQIPMLAGREFEDRDRANPDRVAIVNESLVRHYFKGRNPLGATVSMGSAPPAEIVGVAADSRSLNLREPVKDALYRPTFAATIIARVKPGVSTSTATREIGAAISAVTKTVPVRGGTLDEGIRQTFRRDELVARLSAAFGATGALLAFIGLYGAMAQTVTGRTREIGIRIALGARPSRVVALVSGQVVRLIAVGVIVGLPITIGGARLIAPMLFDVSPTDPGILGAAVLLLAGVGFLAGVVPARRAARLDATRALRYE